MKSYGLVFSYQILKNWSRWISISIMMMRKRYLFYSIPWPKNWIFYTVRYINKLYNFIFADKTNAIHYKNDNSIDFSFQLHKRRSTVDGEFIIRCSDIFGGFDTISNQRKFMESRFNQCFRCQRFLSRYKPLCNN